MLEKLIDFFSLFECNAGTIKGIVTALFIGSIFLDVSRIKIDPWKWVLRKMATIFNGEVLGAISALSRRVDGIEQAQLIQQKQYTRQSILNFADECRIHRKHSHEMFKNALRSIDEYEELCKLTTDPNNVAKEAIAYIKETYHNRLIENDFL